MVQSGRRTVTWWLHTVGPGLLSLSPTSYREEFQAPSWEDFCHSSAWPADLSSTSSCHLGSGGRLDSLAHLTYGLSTCAHVVRLWGPLCRSEACPSVKVWFPAAVLPSRKRLLASEDNHTVLEVTLQSSFQTVLSGNPSGNMLVGPGGWVARPRLVEQWHFLWFPWKGGLRYSC